MEAINDSVESMAPYLQTFQREISDWKRRMHHIVTVRYWFADYQGDGPLLGRGVWTTYLRQFDSHNQAFTFW